MLVRVPRERKDWKLIDAKCLLLFYQNRRHEDANATSKHVSILRYGMQIGDDIALLARYMKSSLD